MAGGGFWYVDKQIEANEELRACNGLSGSVLSLPSYLCTEIPSSEKRARLLYGTV